MSVELVSRWRTSGLTVENRPEARATLFGAQRVEMFALAGETTAVYTFASREESARVLADAANSRLTVSYLHTPYYVQVANLLVVVTTDDPSIARRAVDALTSSR